MVYIRKEKCLVICDNKVKLQNVSKITIIYYTTVSREKHVNKRVLIQCHQFQLGVMRVPIRINNDYDARESRRPILTVQSERNHTRYLPDPLPTINVFRTSSQTKTLYTLYKQIIVYNRLSDTAWVCKK